MTDRIFAPGTYKIQGLFWICTYYTENKVKKVLINGKELFSEFKLTLDEEVKFADFILECVTGINEELANYLTYKQIITWFPAKGLSFECHDDTISICYYHDKRLHNYIYDFTLDKMPNFDFSSLDKFYNNYALTSKSPEIFRKETFLGQEKLG